MILEILQLKLPPDYSENDLLNAISGRLRTEPAVISQIKILRRAIDARERFKGNIYFILNVQATISDNINLADLWQVKEITPHDIESAKTEIRTVSSRQRPIVIGTGPAGLFTALQLAESGLKPLIFERGKKVRERSHDVGRFWGKGKLDPQSNVLYGEGGAGTFSDGKINTRSKDKRRTGLVREIFFRAGAEKEVLYDAAFHIGSDRLKIIITQIRKLIEDLGGTFLFNTRVTDLLIHDNKIAGVIAGTAEYLSDSCFLATGHSAYDIYELLEDKGIVLEAKPFATGVRVEIPQDAVDISQYGTAKYKDILGAAPFSLTLDKSCYTFCMCPGGSIIACSTENGSLFTNGMSLSGRNGRMANAAFLLPQSFATFSQGRKHIQTLEKAAYDISQGKFLLPLTTMEKFPFACSALPENRSNKRTVPADFSHILPEKMCSDLKSFIPQMLSKMKTVDPARAIIVGPETRSSSPVRIPRNPDLESVQITGLYPIGEGSGYAGGIMSSAIDGLKAAENFMLKH